MIDVESSGMSDIGRRRELNEDSFFYDDGMGLYIVADGMGGHNAGEVASKLVVDTIHDYLNQDPDQDSGQDVIKTNGNLSKDARRLLAGIQLSNHVVHQAALQNEDYNGMGSTVSAVYLTDTTIIVANVGDSLVYLIRNGNIKLLSVPHTLVAEQAELDPENAELLWNDFKHVLTRAMGVDKSVQADLKEIPFFKNDILVMCSDGLTDKATPEEILELVENQRSDLACRKLVDLANVRGGEDNITAIVLKIKSDARNSRRIFGWLKDIFQRL
ncbi:MAG: protein phosphatase 2C domain-containing protein [Desulfobacterales bacterium]|jgi:protein phosphatase